MAGILSIVIWIVVIVGIVKSFSGDGKCGRYEEQY